jgi:hypothetical protein
MHGSRMPHTLRLDESILSDVARFKAATAAKFGGQRPVREYQERSTHKTAQSARQYVASYAPMRPARPLVKTREEGL